MATRKQLEREVARNIRASEAEVEAFVMRLERFLDKNLSRILASIGDGRTLGIQAAQVLGGLESELRAAGLGRLLGDIENLFGTELEAVRDALEMTDIEVLTDADFELAENLITYKVQGIGTHITGYTDRLKSAVMAQVITGDRPDIAELLDVLGSSTARNIETDLNTALAGFNRTLTATKAEDAGFKLMVYLGPLDKITRPFCRKLVGKVFKISEIKSMDNGQGLSALVYGGGYNCRHQWRPVSEELAKDFGWRE